MNAPDLKLLQSFIAVAEELHFGRAARRLHISQPPLSKQIQKLERTMGVRLFERTKRRVELTTAGRIFLDEAQAVLRQAGQAMEMARRAARGETGSLSVGFIESALYSVVPQVVRQFTDRYPNVVLSLAEMRIPDQVQAILKRHLDVGFIHLPAAHDDLIAETVLREPVVVALPATHPLASESEITLKDLARETLIQFPRAIHPAVYDDIAGLCRAAGFDPRVVREAAPKQTIIALVSAGLGVSVLPASLQALQRPGVVYRPIRGRNISIETAVIYRRSEPSPVVHAFLEVLRAGVTAQTGAAP